MTLLRWRMVAFLATYLALYHLYIGIFGSPTNRVFLPVHLCLSLSLCFLAYPASAFKKWTNGLDLLGAAASLGLLAWCLINIEDWDLKSVGLSTIDYLACTLMLFLVAEAVRRTTGWSLIVLSGLFVVHALWAKYFPGILNGAGVSWESLLITLVIGDSGIFGIPVLVIAQYVVLFLLFGRLLQVIGAGSFFSRLAFSLFGSRVGGPAKAAVVSSGLFGTLSGSGVSNVLTTGSFTIPMMIRLGYKPPFAAGVEAAAAVGGAIMPPVMGAVAFMMAEFMGVSYAQIAMAAAIPAFLYYFAIYATVHFEASRLRLRGIPENLLPKPWPLMKQEGYLLLPLATIVAFILLGYSVVLVVVWSVLTTFIISFRKANSAVSPARWASALIATGQLTGPLTATCAIAGLLIGSMNATGVGFQLSQGLIALSGQTQAGLLVMSALLALLLGTGLTASAVYITMVATVIPILKSAGVSDMAAHMFAFYFGVVSDITPPTALAAVTAAGIAKSHPVTTMNQASRIGIAAFIVPFLFVYSPALLMNGTLIEIITSTLTAALGLACLSAALTGYAWGELKMWERIGLGLACLSLITSEFWVDLLGVLLAVVSIARSTWFENCQPTEDLQKGWSEAELKVVGEWIRNEAPPPPPAADLYVWRGWITLVVVVFIMGWMGSVSFHSREVLFWLVGLLICTALTLWTISHQGELAHSNARSQDSVE